LKENILFPKNLLGIEAELITEESAEQFFQIYKKRFKRLDVFIHLLGGFWMGGELADTSKKNWETMLDLNLNSTFSTTRHAFKILKKQGGGKIFTVGAKSAEELPAEMGAYAVSKAGVLALTEVLAKEGKPYRIQVNSILPSVIDTSANRHSMPNADFDKWVTPKEIADVLITLSRPETNALSGTALRIFGRM
jgi:NAD(P)-dependent dehydrogenase (short-subunit alcohol dehydrogenase family)